MLPVSSIDRSLSTRGSEMPQKAVIRLATAVIKFRNKERNVRSPTYGKCVRNIKLVI